MEMSFSSADRDFPREYRICHKVRTNWTVWAIANLKTTVRLRNVARSADGSVKAPRPWLAAGSYRI